MVEKCFDPLSQQMMIIAGCDTSNIKSQYADLLYLVGSYMEMRDVGQLMGTSRYMY